MDFVEKKHSKVAIEKFSYLSAELELEVFLYADSLDLNWLGLVHCGQVEKDWGSLSTDVQNNPELKVVFILSWF